MTCNITAELVNFDENLIIRISALCLVLSLVVGGNLALYFKVRGRGRKWVAMDWLLKVMAITGVLNGVINIGIYLISICLGSCALGEGLCQVFGVVNSVLVSTWTWILALAAAERFLRLVVPSEHPSMFSEVNTRIMTWGAILLIVVLYLGPIYGWGEYSFYRGKLDLVLAVKNYTATETSSGETTVSTPANISSMPAQSDVPIRFYSLLWQLTQTGNISVQETLKNLSGMSDLYFRRPQLPTANGIVYPVRVRDEALLLCLRDHSVSERLSAELERVLYELDVPILLNVQDLRLVTRVELTQLETFRKVEMTYQESAKCGLDYSRVNDNIYTFVGLSWICCLIIPFGITCYCHVRTLWVGRKSLHIFTVEGTSQEDMYVTRVLAYASLVTFLCDAPYFGVNLAAGLGVYIPRDAIFTAHFLLFFSWALPWLIFTCTSTSVCARCCCTCACLCERLPRRCRLLGDCAAPEVAAQRKRNRVERNDLAQTHELEVKRGLLSSVTSATNSPALSVNSSVVRQKDLETVL